MEEVRWCRLTRVPTVADAFNQRLKVSPLMIGRPDDPEGEDRPMSCGCPPAPAEPSQQDFGEEVDG
jgi:hypothetical protein